MPVELTPVSQLRAKRGAEALLENGEAILGRCRDRFSHLFV